MRTSRFLSLILLGSTFGATFGASSAMAAPGALDESRSVLQLVPPTIIFVVDLSADMQDPCDASTGRTTPCIEDVADTIEQVTRHFDWATFGVVGTSETESDDAFYRIAPAGSSYAEIAGALSTLTTFGGETRNLAEVLEALSDDYLDQTDPDDGEDDDVDGFTGDWDETPIEYACSTTHVIVFTTDQPENDEQVDGSSRAGLSTDIECLVGASGSGGGPSGGATTDVMCFYDNLVGHLYAADQQSLLSGSQNVVVHTVGLGLTAGSIADQLYQNAADQTSGEGIYTNASTPADMLSGTLAALSDIQSGTYSRSAPVLSADGAYMLYSFYEIVGDNPLAQGHIRAYEMDTDPSSSTYGQIVYEGPSEYEGALWDGGDLLVSRLVLAGESNPEDRDGVGQRDIYFFDEYAYNSLPTMEDEAEDYRRMGLDADFVDAVRGTPGALSYYLDTTSTISAPCADDDAYDLNDDCLVDADDLQLMVDFVRGYPDSTFRYLDITRGRWKLADSPYAVPALVSARNGVYSTDKTYQNFIDSLEAEDVPSVVFLPANDGMLHAFRLEDDPTTLSEDEAGEELWAWIPSYLTHVDREHAWTSGLMDLVWYGRTFLFDGSPVVEDVWIDDGDGNASEAGNGVKAADGSEWKRVLVVSQGFGGPVTLALDITDTRDPKFLWEQTNTTDPTSMGYTVGRPSVFNIYDNSSSVPKDRWVAMWGSGRAVPYSSTTNAYYESAEPTLFMWGISDYESYTGWDDDPTDNYTITGDDVGLVHPDLSLNGGGVSGTAALQYDSDSAVERGYISASLAVVDVDGDGDADVAYFPLTTSYRPTDEGGGGESDIESPGSSWIYKVILDSTDPDNYTWCEFYDPYSGTDGSNGIGARPEVFYAATAAWRNDGDLAVFWGTGTPFDRTSSTTGYFFAMKDTDPLSCTTAEPIECDGNAGGFKELEAGEGLTSEPIVSAGVVYFSSYLPNSDRCEAGEGRIYGLNYSDCSGALDTDGDGDAEEYVSLPGFVSNATVSESGDVYVGVSGQEEGDNTAHIEMISVADAGLLGTRAVAWMEMY